MDLKHIIILRMKYFQKIRRTIGYGLIIPIMIPTYIIMFIFDIERGSTRKRRERYNETNKQESQ
jgi:hypothetical protein